MRNYDERSVSEVRTLSLASIGGTGNCMALSRRSHGSNQNWRNDYSDNAQRFREKRPEPADGMEEVIGSPS